MTNTLKTLCLMTREELFSHLEAEYGFERIKNHMVLEQYDNCPLVVCHADTVVSHRMSDSTNYSQEGDTITSISLDDRLGIWLMLRLVDDGFRINCLVTDDEEIGRSTSQEYVTDKHHTWLLQLDRRGYDVVTYEYDAPIWHSVLESLGFTVGQGSFSDICYLSHLGICGVNVGIGYHQEHSQQCHCDISKVESRYEHIWSMIATIGGLRFAHVPDPFSWCNTRASDDFEFDEGYFDARNREPMTDDSKTYLLGYATACEEMFLYEDERCI